MIRRYPLLLIICGFLVIIGLALWPGHWSPGASANVTLVSFTATSVPGQPGIHIRWETGTEMNTVGFFVMRGDSFNGAFARLSGFIPHEGDTIVGAKYEWLDAGAVSPRTYWYQLEEITTNQQSEFYGPITATLSGPTVTPTATPTSPAEDVDPTSTSHSRIVATPRVGLGETITPRPASSLGGSPSPAVSAVAPTPTTAPDSSLPPATAVAAAPAVLDAANVATAVIPPPPTAAHVAQASAPALASTGEASAVVEPVIIARETAPRTTPANSANRGALILVAAAILFLGIALLILRQARQ